MSVFRAMRDPGDNNKYPRFMRIGSHVDAADPIAEARARNADVVQFFLGNPQRWAKPTPRNDAQELREADVDIYIHSPYLINVASPNNKVRVPSRRLMFQQAQAAAQVGAKGLVVHGGSVTKGTDMAVGYDNWRKAFQYGIEQGGFDVPILIENTAGGDYSCARYFDSLAALWEVIGEFEPGFCLDTCHAHAGGEDLSGVVERVTAITGKIDLIHANDSRFEFGSGRDRHANIGSGTIDPQLIANAIAEAGCPAVVETPGEAQDQAEDIEKLRKRITG